MRRSHVIIIIAAVATSLASCASDNASVYIEGNVIPEQQDVGCSLTADGAQLTSGFYNVDFPSAYRVFPLYNNQLLSRATDVRADPNGILIRGAEVELQDLAGAPMDFGGLPNPFTIPASTFINSGDVGQPGRNVGELEVIPDPYRAFMAAGGRRGTIVITVKVFGRTNGNIDIQAGAWQWPVAICGGNCLFECLAADDTTEVLSCSPGQDFGSRVRRDIPGVINCLTTPAP